MNSFRIETRASRRISFVEPYIGLGFLAEFLGSGASLFAPAGDVNGIINHRPPMQGELTLGAALIPWEDRARSQRFALDIRGIATYISQGQEITPLFDALGTSQDPALTSANTYKVGSATRNVYDYGVTDVQAHARVGGRFAIEMYAARYSRFAFIGSIFYTTPYFITAADACNASVSANGIDAGNAGTCRQGVVNPNSRAVLDAPGRRYQLDNELSFSMHANVTATFSVWSSAFLPSSSARS